ncbi:citramalate synthase [Opitutus sp. GAS368]|uniref:citramalate synthase n=1 Tax=Opitutus sp. GAS368 TaxID=1882749 RepID=UPI00087A515B|nr:citramalate synthase [Opitutus sp. GAS368]SDS33790.1 2-isopropylmalate synthase [Opitutus sp. GAS368]
MTGTAQSVSVEIFDTTLRDGAQTEGISYSVDDKLRIARKLDELGVRFIEGGWPGSNPKDALFFEQARTMPWSHAKIVAFGATRRASLKPADDASVRALVDAGTEVCAIFGKSSVLQVKEVLRTTLEENLKMIEETVAYLRGQGKRVIYDAEHFFDGYRLDATYALQTLQAAVKGGAETIVLCDTNGGSLPWQVEAAVTEVRARLGSAPVGIHAHDDTGCGVANSMAAVRAGARHVQGTINGYGERCGNANLCVVIPNLELKLNFRTLPSGALARLHEVARFVAEVANLAPNEHMAYVGDSAFAHKAGVHVAAMQRHPDAYQHIDPTVVGNEMRVVVSELSGRANVVSKASELGLQQVDAATGAKIVELIKAKEHEGFSFEAAEASVALLVRRITPGYQPLFTLLDYRGMVSRHGERSMAEATIKLSIGGHEVHTAAEGNGPVNAFDQALRKALQPLFPQVKDISLADYKVRILNSNLGTAAITRVLIDWHDGVRRWSTVGAGSNILDATWLALADGYEYSLTPQAVGAVAPNGLLSKGA